MRTIMIPVAGFTALQLHKYVTFSWLMELLLVGAVVAPYMPTEKKMVDVGVQTNVECTDIQIFHKPRKIMKIDKVMMLSVLVGFVGYFVTTMTMNTA
jgi:hypothetical protein